MGYVTQSMKRKSSVMKNSVEKYSSIAHISPIKKTQEFDKSDYKEILKLMKSKEKSKQESKLKMQLQNQNKQIQQEIVPKIDFQIKEKMPAMQTIIKKNLDVKKISIGNTTAFNKEYDPFDVDSKFENTVYFKTEELIANRPILSEPNSSSLKDLLHFNFEEIEEKPEDKPQEEVSILPAKIQIQEIPQQKIISFEPEKQQENKQEKSPQTSKLKISEDIFKAFNDDLSFENLSIPKEKKNKEIQQNYQQVQNAASNQQSVKKVTQTNYQFQQVQSPNQNQQQMEMSFQQNDNFDNDNYDYQMEIEKSQEKKSAANKSLVTQKSPILMNQSKPKTQTQNKQKQANSKPRSNSKTKSKQKNKETIGEQISEQYLGSQVMIKDIQFQKLNLDQTFPQILYQQIISSQENDLINIGNLHFPLFIFYACPKIQSLDVNQQPKRYNLWSKGNQNLIKTNGFVQVDPFAKYDLYPMGFSNTVFFSKDFFRQLDVDLNYQQDQLFAIQIKPQGQSPFIQCYSEHHVKIVTWSDYISNAMLTKIIKARKEEPLVLYKDVETKIEDNCTIQITNNSDSEIFILFKYQIFN